MKQYLLILSFACTLVSCAQSKQTTTALANTKLLERTVFGTKDSLTLESLFAGSLSYIHSSGKVENRQQAIHGIITNKSVYTKSDTLSGYDVKQVNDSIIVRQSYIATEKKPNGAESPLRIVIELVWAKENGTYKLFRRQASKL